MLVAALAVSSSGCAGSEAIQPGIPVDSTLRGRIAALDTTIAGGGASFPDAFYQAVNADFNGLSGAERVGYAKSGSSDGRAQLAAGTLDFAGSDSLPSPEEHLPADLLFFPTVAAPITISYNLPDVPELTFSARTLALVLQARITRWNAPELAADNPRVMLPDRAIHVVHRSDGSGTTRNLTAYLQAAAPDSWRLGVGDEVSWPRATQGAEKNSGVAQVIGTTVGAVGYVDLGDAAKAGLQIARLRNANGEAVLPTATAVGRALSGARISPDLTFDPLNSSAEGAYPLTAPTWLLVPAERPTGVARTLRVYLRFLLGPAQDQALALGYVPLPEDLARRALAQVERISG